MDIVFGILAVGMAAAPLAVVAAWLAAAGVRPLGDLIRGSGEAGDWWRTTMPWPRGVQEEDGIRWGGRQMFASDESADPGETIADRARIEGLYVARTRARPRIRLR